MAGNQQLPREAVTAYPFVHVTGDHPTGVAGSEEEDAVIVNEIMEIPHFLRN